MYKINNKFYTKSPISTKRTMAIHTVLHITLLFFNEVFSKCEDVSFIRSSNEFTVIKNKSIPINPTCLSGVLLEKKLDRSLYCMKKQPTTKRTYELNCLERSLERCENGTENPPSLSQNRIMFPRGLKIKGIFNLSINIFYHAYA